MYKSLKPEDLAGKKFAIFGLGFNGNNIKYIQKRKVYGTNDIDEDDPSVIGWNKKGEKKWGNFVVLQDGENLILDYGFMNRWPISGLKDKISFDSQNLPDCLIDLWKDINKPGIEVLAEHGVNISSDFLVLKGIAYWYGMRLGKFWMVEIVDKQFSWTLENKYDYEGYK
jgi:hypothetical protein